MFKHALAVRQIYNDNIRADLLDILEADLCHLITAKKTFPLGAAWNDELTDAARTGVKLKIGNVTKLPAVSQVNHFFTL